MRDQIVDFVRRWSKKTEIGAGRFVGWLGVTASKFYDWRERYGKVNEHNGWVPRDFWLEDWEKQAIIDFHLKNPLEGYRRLTFMMLDADIVAVSPSSVWRVLGQAGLLQKWKGKPSKKGHGLRAAARNRISIGISTFPTSISAARSTTCAACWTATAGSIVHWDLRESMTEAEIEIILEAAKEKYPEAKPRIISDNGPQFIARDFKEFIRISGMTHVRTSPYYPAIQRQDRALAQIAERRMHPAGNAVDEGGRAAAHSGVRGPLQHRAPAQRHRIRHAGGYAGGAASRDPCGAGLQAGRSACEAEKTPAAGRREDGVTMTLPGETEAGSAGMQPCRGIAWWAHRDDVAWARKFAFRALPKTHRIGRPLCLENPRPEGAEYSLTESASLHFTLNRHTSAFSHGKAVCSECTYSGSASADL